MQNLSTIGQREALAEWLPKEKRKEEQLNRERRSFRNLHATFAEVLPKLDLKGHRELQRTYVDTDDSVVLILLPLPLPIPFLPRPTGSPCPNEHSSPFRALDSIIPGA